MRARAERVTDTSGIKVPPASGSRLVLKNRKAASLAARKKLEILKQTATNQQLLYQRPLLPSDGQAFDFNKMTDAIKNFQFSTTSQHDSTDVSNAVVVNQKDDSMSNLDCKWPNN